MLAALNYDTNIRENGWQSQLNGTATMFQALERNSLLCMYLRVLYPGTPRRVDKQVTRLVRTNQGPMQRGSRQPPHSFARHRQEISIAKAALWVTTYPLRNRQLEFSTHRDTVLQ